MEEGHISSLGKAREASRRRRYHTGSEGGGGRGCPWWGEVGGLKHGTCEEKEKEGDPHGRLLAAGPPGNGAGVYQTRDRGPPGKVGTRYPCGLPPKSAFPTVHLEVNVAGLKQWSNLSGLVSLSQISNRSSKSCWQGFPFLVESRWLLDCNSTNGIWRTPCFAVLLG